MECSSGEMDHYEKLFIDLYNSKCPDGYNLDDGGNTNKTRSEETRAAISDGMKRAQKEGRYRNPTMGMTTSPVGNISTLLGLSVFLGAIV